MDRRNPLLLPLIFALIWSLFTTWAAFAPDPMIEILKEESSEARAKLRECRAELIAREPRW